TNTFAANIAGVIEGYSKTRDGKSAIIAPGVEVKSSGDLTLSSDWTLGDVMPSGGILTLSAANNLILNGNINYIQSQSPSSWSYRLVAGADAASINPEIVTKGIGNITLADSKFVRTGTGFIHAVAGNDIQLGTEDGTGAAIYTLGLPDTTNPVNFVKLNPQDKEFYSDGGGNIKINAGGNVSGSATAAETQDVAKWLYTGVRSDSINGQARWWSRYDTVTSGVTKTRSKGFTNGIATLGGGDVSIQTGGDLNNMQVAAASNGRMGGSPGDAPSIANFLELGGGNVDIQAAGSINQVLLHSAHGDITANAGADTNVQLSLMDSKVALLAADNLAITNVSNATNHLSSLSDDKFRVDFYTYADQTSIGATSLTGNVTVKGGEKPFPSKLFAAAPDGDVNVESVVLYPSKTGNVTLLAGHDVNINSLVMSEVDPGAIPVITTPKIKTAIIPLLNNYQGISGHTEGLLHIADVEPVRVYAQHDVIFKKDNPLITTKRTEVIAGHDVVDPNLIIQNLKSTDVSLIQAGNDIRYSDPERSGDKTLAINAGIQIAGPGRLHLIANGDIDLGASKGIQSIGNINNPFLPEQGADIMVQPGAAAVADYNGIINTYIDPLSQYSNIYLPQLTSFMQQRTGNQALVSTQALADFKMLDKQAQTAFINQVFFAELKAGGRDAIDSNSSSFGDYSRSERAILHMFPEFTTNQTLVSQAGSIMKDFGNIAKEQVTHPGDLNLFYSQIRSERGGRIELLVPGGLVNAGLAVAGGPVKPDTDLGIVSLRGGELLGFVRNDFQVNQSRVFTLGGSDLMLYSALDDIDAGKGAKTSSSTPPPEVRIINGRVVYDYSGAVAGSGIAALTSTGGSPGTVDLFAPYGEINAGEAGIRSAGNINLGARVITGADNIVAGGVTTGAPVASVAGLSVTAPASTDSTSASKQGDQVGDATKQASNNKLAALPSLITVEVLSLGDESAAPTSQCKDESNKKDCKN
ncbi:MAG: filamentous hemagglutinin family protein, partial [Methylotenera sp.]|nr:filamentous hemagglutinin family protein [Methylotenera sp.]